jgi:chromosome segregation ATPase
VYLKSRSLGSLNIEKLNGEIGSLKRELFEAKQREKQLNQEVCTKDQENRDMQAACKIQLEAALVAATEYKSDLDDYKEQLRKIESELAKERE